MSVNFSKLVLDNIESAQRLEDGEYELKIKLNHSDFWRCKILNGCRIENDLRYVILKYNVERESIQSVEHFLRCAIGEGAVSIANEIIDHNPNIIHDKTYCPLIRTCASICDHNQNVQILEHLLKSGSDPNMRLHIMTPLMHLVEAYVAEYCYKGYHAHHYLNIEFNNYAELRVENFTGYIRYFNRATIQSIDLLMSYGADLFVRDKDGKLAKDHARTIDIYLHLKRLYGLELLKGEYFSVLPPDLIKCHMIKFISDEIINSL